VIKLPFNDDVTVGRSNVS